MLLFLGIGISLAIYIYFVRDNFFSELLISFLPYVGVCCCLSVIILGIYLYYYGFHKINHKSFYIFFSFVLFIGSIGISWLYAQEYFGFYNQSSDKIRLVNQTGVKVFYANILYTNTDFSSLQKKIEQENPDIVVLVEFSDAHEKEMKSFFQKNYPYMNRNSWSSMLAGDVVFSKIPLDTSLDQRKNDGAWHYSRVRLLCDESAFCEKGAILYIVHTAAPVSKDNYKMRNIQLEKIRNGYKKQKEELGEVPTLIIGDFNLTPWSYNYKSFMAELNMNSALSYQNPNYTWSLWQQGIFRSHIDQLFVSPEIKVSEVKIETLTGSDHRLFSFSFGVK